MFCRLTKQLVMSAESCNRFQVLSYEQVHRLHEVMETEMPVHGKGNFPTLHITLKELVQLVREQLRKDGLVVKDIRLNGGAASYILSCDSIQAYNDLDLIFRIGLPTQDEMQTVKNAVLSSLLDFLPKGVKTDKMGPGNMKEAYVQKMVKVNTANDRWSLISLSNNNGRNVELKFVDSMKRQFEFSVDSFQILLDSLLAFYDVSRQTMSEHFYPTVVAESVYGDFGVALDHLDKKLIATRNPEEIRGGGLFKYCNLLVRGYVPAGDVDIKDLQKYMCSRFFIDFPDIEQQRQKLESYLTTHFMHGDEHLKYEYLMTLYDVVNASTICLMGNERRQTLALIHQMATNEMIERDRKMRGDTKQTAAIYFDQWNIPTFDHKDLIIDQVFYGPFNLPFASEQNQSFYSTQYPSYGADDSYSVTCPLCAPYLQCY